MIKKIWEYNKFRFFCVGVFNTLLDLSILNTLVFILHFPVWGANFISVSISVSISYFLNHRIVFRHHERPNFLQYVKFMLVTGTSVIVLQTVIIYLTKSLYLSLVNKILGANSHDIQIALNLSKITAVLLGLVWNFLFYSKVVFRNKASDVDEERSSSMIV